jgi:hypothetical protein
MIVVRNRRVVIAAVAAVAALASATAALGLPPFNNRLPKSSPPLTASQAQLANVTSACHNGFDRIVFRFTSGKPGYNVRYVTRIVKDPSGLPVSLLGNVKLSIVFQNARAHRAGGGSLGIPSVRNPLCTNVRQLKATGDFEGVVSWGAGLYHKADFRVFRLTNPTRVVIDVHH